MGFMNFELGAGCALLAAAWWISADGPRWVRRLILATLFSTGLYFVHFYCWAFYGLFLLSYELHLIWRRARKFADVRPGVARLLLNGTQAIPALALITCVARASVHSEPVFSGFKPPYLRISEFGHLIDVGHPIWNVAFLVLLGLLALVVFRRRWIAFRSDLIWPIGACLCIFFVLPDQISDASYVSWRILLMMLLVSVASCCPCEQGESRVNLILGVVALVTLGIASLQLLSWRNSEIDREAFITVAQEVPEGSSLFVVHNGMTLQQLRDSSRGLYHVGAYAVMTRRALVQSLFVVPGQQILRFRNAKI